MQFSVIIPALNEEKFLPHLLESLAVQTKKDVEVIVVDGGSTDKTIEVANSFARKIRSLHVISAGRASLPFQRNIGARKASNEWLVFVDADSVLFPTFIERIGAFVSDVKPNLFTTWFRPDSDHSGDAMIALAGLMAMEASILLKRSFTPGPLTAVKKQIFQSVGGYDESHAFHEDMDFGIRLEKAGIHLSILREVLWVWSLRRLRSQGVLKVMQQYVLSAFPVLLFRKPMKYMPGYTMGGQIYNKTKKKLSPSMVKRYEKKLKNLMKELFE